MSDMNVSSNVPLPLGNKGVPASNNYGTEGKAPTKTDGTSGYLSVKQALNELLVTNLEGGKAFAGNIVEEMQKWPVLTPPCENQLTSEAKFTATIGTLVKTTDKLSSADLLNRLQQLKSRELERRGQIDKLSSQYDHALEESAATTKALEGETEKLGTLKGEMDNLQATQGNADKEAVKLFKENPGLLVRAGYSADSDISGMDHAGLVQLASAALNAQQALEQNDDGFSDELSKTLNNIINNFSAVDPQIKAKQQEINEAEGKVQQLISESIDKTSAVTEVATRINELAGALLISVKSYDKELSNMATMSKLMAVLSNLIGKNSEENLKRNQDVYQKMQEARQKEIEKQMEEQQKNIEEATALQKKMSNISRIFGAVITAIGIVSALFSGGAGIAIAIIGLGLMAADKITQVTTGVSFMEQAMKPLMTKILQPLMSLIGDAITKSLIEDQHMDPAKAKMIGAILGAVLAVAVLVVSAIAGVKIAGKILPKLFPQLIKNLFEGMHKLGEKIGSFFVEHLPRVAAFMAKDSASAIAISTTGKITGVVLELVDASLQAHGNITVADFEEKATNAEAEIHISKAERDQLQKLLAMLTDYLADSMAQVKSVNNQIFAMLSKSGEAGRFVLRG